jgi:predicted alpha/beta hydrolase family esterase
MLKWGFKDHHVIRRRAIKPRAIVASKDDYLILAFRGTDNIQETLADFVIVTTKSGNPAFKGKVHRGFWSLYENIRKEFLAKVKKYAKGGKRIYITGHSMGSAMAIYAAHELDYLGYNVAGLYEFASPRYGNEGLTNYFRSVKFPKYNIAEPTDIVPQIPPTRNSMDSFLRLTDYLSPILKPIAAELISKSNYGYHTTDSFFLVKDQHYDEYSYSEQKDLELDYWGTLERELMDIPKKSWIKHIESRTKTHPGDRYVCLLRNK